MCIIRINIPHIRLFNAFIRPLISNVIIEFTSKLFKLFNAIKWLILFSIYGENKLSSSLLSQLFNKMYVIIQGRDI